MSKSDIVASLKPPPGDQTELSFVDTTNDITDYTSSFLQPLMFYPPPRKKKYLYLYYVAKSIGPAFTCT